MSSFSFFSFSFSLAIQLDARVLSPIIGLGGWACLVFVLVLVRGKLLDIDLATRSG